MTHRHPPRRLVATALALALTTVTGPLALPAVADSPVGTVRSDTGTPASATALLPPDTEVVMAGATGFLASTPACDLLWIRYADGSATDLGRQTYRWRAAEHHGSVSDVVAFEHGYEGVADHWVELRDMSTGEVSVVALGAYRTVIEVVGPTVLTRRWTPGAGADRSSLSVTGMVDGVQTDRVVTGLPEGAQNVSTEASAPGSLVLRYSVAGAGTTVHYAVVDLATGAATPSHLATSSWGGSAVSPEYLAALNTSSAADAELLVENRATGAVTRVDTHRAVSEPLTGLVGDWALFGSSNSLRVGGAEDHSLRAVPVGGGASRKILDHATSLAPTAAGDVMVMGGTLARGEGVYRVSLGADGAPFAELVAGTGQPMGITLVSTDIPAVATLDPQPWRARWKLSRSHAEVTLTLRHTATGATSTYFLSPSDRASLIDLEWNGTMTDEAAPNGAYTWRLTAKPINGLGPDLRATGTFKVRARRRRTTTRTTGRRISWPVTAPACCGGRTPCRERRTCGRPTGRESAAAGVCTTGSPPSATSVAPRPVTWWRGTRRVCCGSIWAPARAVSPRAPGSAAAGTRTRR